MSIDLQDPDSQEVSGQFFSVLSVFCLFNV
jgi:hypothetical protein